MWNEKGGGGGGHDIRQAANGSALNLLQYAQVMSAYFSPCVLSMVDEETDLILVEFTYNDSAQTYIKQLEADSM